MNNITAAVALPSQMNVVNVLVDLTIAHCIPYKAIDTIAHTWLIWDEIFLWEFGVYNWVDEDSK